MKEHLEYLRNMEIKDRWRNVKTFMFGLIAVIILGVIPIYRITGANTSWKDTMYVDLVVIGHPIGSQTNENTN
jgi:hypothetical protein